MSPYISFLVEKSGTRLKYTHGLEGIGPLILLAKRKLINSLFNTELTRVAKLGKIKGSQQ